MNRMIVIASKNKHKIKEIQEILKRLPFDIQSMDVVGLNHLEVIEDGKTFEENSMKKAIEIMKATGSIAIADDSGLEVAILGNKPGIYSARFSGEGATDEKNNQKLKRLLKNVPYEKREARFVSVISVAFPDGKKISVRGECSGFIGFEERGTNGFGYDPLFIVPEYKKTFAELSSNIKNTISHRAKALQKLKQALLKTLEEE